MALLLLLHLGHSSSTFVPSLTTVPSRLYSVAQSRWARCPAPLANEYDDWWNERRAQHTAVSTQAWAAARAREAAYNTGSAEGRAALRAARAKAASAQAAASAAGAAPGALLQLDEDFYWSAGIMGDELSCWSPPPSSSVALVLHEFLRSDYAQVLFNNYQVAGTEIGQVRGMFVSVRLRGGTLELQPKQAFANVEGLFERLSTYVRARLPQIRQIHEKIRDGIKIH